MRREVRLPVNANDALVGVTDAIVHRVILDLDSGKPPEACEDHECEAGARGNPDHDYDAPQHSGLIFGRIDRVRNPSVGQCAGMSLDG